MIQFRLPPPAGSWHLTPPPMVGKTITYSYGQDFKPTYQPRNPGMELAEVLPQLEKYKTKCPVPMCNEFVTRPRSLYSLIQHLNDTHEWPREEIADWLETLDVDLTFKIGREEGKDVNDSGDEG